MPRQSYRKPTIHDVASEAGVSITTVSHFVSGREGACSPETARRIRTAIESLHYTPSSLSRGLGKRATRVIGVCMYNPSDEAEYPFTDRVWRGLNREADSQDYSLLHYPTSVREDEDYRVFLDGRVDGLIFGAAGHGDPRPAQLAAAGMPMVLITRSHDIPDGCGAAYADEAEAVGLALTHLWSLGHRRFGHLAGPAEATRDPGLTPNGRRWNDIARWRSQAFVAWLTARGVAEPLVSAPNPNWEAVNVRETLAEWRRLTAPPTALFCANDALALDALDVAREIGWRVPQDLSVVGVDNQRDGAASRPALTSVEIDGAQIGHEALRCLLRLMDGASAETCRVAIPVNKIVVRASTAVCPTNKG